jgi:hypothetical protein
MTGGVAGKPDDDLLSLHAAPGRAAGLHCEPPEQLLDAERGQRGLDVIARPDRHATGGDDDIGLLERLRECLARRAGVVADALDGHDVRTRLRAARRDEDAVRLVNLAVSRGSRARRASRDHDGTRGAVTRTSATPGGGAAAARPQAVPGDDDPRPAGRCRAGTSSP